MTDSVHHEEPAGVNRRTLLQIPLTVAGAMCFGALAKGARRVAHLPGSANRFEEFTERWRELLKSLSEASDPNEDEYLFHLCGEISALDREEFPQRSATTFSQDGMSSGGAWGDGALSVIEFDLEPGAEVRAHNHVGFSFISLGISGSCQVRHFEPHGEYPDPGSGSQESFLVQETRSKVLKPGHISHLSRTRDNIHWFRAGEEGARFLDFGTYLNDAGEGYTSFSVLDFDEDPINPEERLFEANWIGNPYK